MRKRRCFQGTLTWFEPAGLKLPKRGCRTYMVTATALVNDSGSVYAIATTERKVQSEP